MIIVLMIVIISLIVNHDNNINTNTYTNINTNDNGNNYTTHNNYKAPWRAWSPQAGRPGAWPSGHRLPRIIV